MYVCMNMIAKNQKAKLETIPLKFGGVWILHVKVLKFGFYYMKFNSVYISCHSIIFSIKYNKNLPHNMRLVYPIK